MKNRVVCLSVLFLLVSCASYQRQSSESLRSPSSVEFERSTLLKFPSQNIDSIAIESALSEKLGPKITINKVEQPTNPFRYVGSLIYGDNIGYIVDLLVGLEDKISCSLYEHSPGNKKVLVLSSCSGEEEVLNAVLKENRSFLHLSLDLFAE